MPHVVTGDERECLRDERRQKRKYFRMIRSGGTRRGGFWNRQTMIHLSRTEPFLCCYKYAIESAVTVIWNMSQNMVDNEVTIVERPAHGHAC
jgi:hypothetical protein